MASANLPHLAARVINTPLLVEPGKAEVILSVLAPRLGLDAPPRQAEHGGGYEHPDCEIKGGIAVIPVHGSLVQRGSWLDAESGLTSYDAIRERLDEALADSAVSAILLDVDSPGGEVAGCFDLADYIHAARAQKPIWAVANEAAFSAAYALASAAERLWVTRTAGVGSVGVIAMHVDYSQAEKAAGIKVTPIFAGKHKNDFSPHEPLSRDARGRLQAEIDRVYGLFVGAVARNRGLSLDSVRATEAGLYFGPNAVESGLADTVGSFEEALAALAEGGARISTKGTILMTNAAPKPSAEAAAAAENEDTVTGGAGDEPVSQPEVTTAPEPTKADPAEVVEACVAAGQPAAAAAFIRQGLTLAQVKQRLDLAGDIRKAVAAAHRLNAAVPLSKADEFIAAGASLADVKAALWDTLAMAAAAVPAVEPRAQKKTPETVAGKDNHGWDGVIAKTFGQKGA